MEKPSIPNSKQFRKILWDQYAILLGLISASLILVADGLGLNRFLSNANKCCGNEAKANIGSLNRAQQSYFLDHGKLASSWKELDLPSNAETEDYSYSIVNFGQHAFNYARSKREGRKSFVGGVFVTKLPEFDELSTVTILCEAKLPGIHPIQPPINAKACSAGTEKAN